MTGVKDVSSVGRFSTCRASGGDWKVVDQQRNDVTVAHCKDANGAELIAALMNGDLSALADASADALAHCRKTLGGALRQPKPRGWPGVGIASFLPQL